MPTLHIKGSTDGKGGTHAVAVLEQGCQTCFGKFEITIPYELGQTKSITVNVTATKPGSHDKPEREIKVG